MELILLIIIIVLLFVFWKFVVWILFLGLLLWLMSVIRKKSFIFKPLVFSIVLLLSPLLWIFVGDLMINDGQSKIFTNYLVPLEIVDYYEYKSHSIMDEIIDSIYNDTIYRTKDYELYNRIVSSDSTHLYGDFYISMPMYKFMNISEDNHYESEYYFWDNSSKYELVDSLYFSLEGIFVERKLIGIKFKSNELECNDKEGSLYIEKLKKSLSKKYGLIHYEKTGDDYYRGAWRFDKKHIVISFNNKSFYTQNRIELYIYAPKVIKEEIIRRRYIAKQKDIQQKKEREEQLRRLEKERQTQLEIKKNDSINEAKRRKSQQEGF